MFLDADVFIICAGTSGIGKAVVVSQQENKARGTELYWLSLA